MNLLRRRGVAGRCSLLLDVESVYASAIAGFCGRSGIRLIDADWDDIGGLDRRDLVMVVAGIAGDPEAAFDRLRVLTKAVRGVPLVVLSREARGELAFQCARLGVTDFVDLPAQPLDVVARIAMHVEAQSGSPEVAALIGQS